MHSPFPRLVESVVRGRVPSGHTPPLALSPQDRVGGGGGGAYTTNCPRRRDHADAIISINLGNIRLSW